MTHFLHPRFPFNAFFGKKKMPRYLIVTITDSSNFPVRSATNGNIVPFAVIASLGLAYLAVKWIGPLIWPTTPVVVPPLWTGKFPKSTRPERSGVLPVSPSDAPTRIAEYWWTRVPVTSHWSPHYEFLKHLTSSQCNFTVKGLFGAPKPLPLPSPWARYWDFFIPLFTPYVNHCNSYIMNFRIGTFTSIDIVQLEIMYEWVLLAIGSFALVFIIPIFLLSGLNGLYRIVLEKNVLKIYIFIINIIKI